MPRSRLTACLVASLFVAAAVASACTSGSHRVASTSSIPASTLPPTTSTTVSIPVTTTTVTTATTVRSATTVKAPPTSVAPATVTAGDADNGKTITLSVGQVLVVTLGAYNWTFSPTSNGTVLSQTGATSSHRASCIPGGTCGTTTAQFVAHRAGTSQVIATRTYCGEAIQCTAATGNWAITVNVTSH